MHLPPNIALSLTNKRQLVNWYDDILIINLVKKLIFGNARE